MKKKHIILTILIVFIAFFPIKIIINSIITNQNQEDAKEINNLISKVGQPTYDEVRKILGEPQSIYDKTKYPYVEYKCMKTGNSGFVAVWDTKNWIGRGHIFVISFNGDTKRAWSIATSL